MEVRSCKFSLGLALLLCCLAALVTAKKPTGKTISDLMDKVFSSTLNHRPRVGFGVLRPGSSPVSWPKVVKGIPNQGLVCSVSKGRLFVFCVSGVYLFRLLVFGCQYECSRLPGKTRLWSNLLCVHWDVYPTWSISCIKSWKPWSLAAASLSEH